MIQQSAMSAERAGQRSMLKSSARPIGEAISPRHPGMGDIACRENRYLLCQRAMLCRAIGAPMSENDVAGFELPFDSPDFEPRIATP
jgi:hypothetical protein